MTNHVESDLRRLAEPTPPATLTATVMARVSRVSDQRAATSVTAPAREVPAWAMLVCGLAIVFVSWIAGGFDAGWWRDLVPPENAATSATAAPFDETAVLGLAFGSLLYLAGLLAPVRSRRLTLPR